MDVRTAIIMQGLVRLHKEVMCNYLSTLDSPSVELERAQYIFDLICDITEGKIRIEQEPGTEGTAHGAPWLPPPWKTERKNNGRDI